ncbi:MAG: co-chaperone GroES [gamma proteobacterium symbiont of Lucinoma myriamae]|nr:co-chaperone GroES [gamma proteobacterium symbiont of Lucinoma myriamae]MCU7818281.1 co-chaperone GroES [gamma proteobacterium symbiont of Lucinoma myriamae]MCU7832199.1 co-chaperone GroES [gamma proteobacterium symbiont of Lucinoma myriamae]
MNIRPLGDRIVVRRLEEETKTAGGIYIPDSATEKPSEGEVVAVGNGRISNKGNPIAMEVKSGDKVIFGKFSGSEVKVGDETLLIMREEDVLAVVE